MKINFAVFLSFIFLLTLNVSAQSVGILKYNYLNYDKKVGISPQERIIYFNNRSSIELAGKSSFKPNDKNDETKESIVLPSKKPVFIYKNFSDKMLSLSERVGLRKYVINDTLSNFKWKITKEKKVILNYTCIKATTKFRGRNYEAWYTEEIPIQNGPWKFCGLPGLIIKVGDVENKFVYELTGINLKAKYDNKIISVPKEYVKDKAITHKQFMILYKKKLEDYAKLSKVVETSADGTSSSVSIYLPEKMEKF